MNSCIPFLLLTLLTLTNGLAQEPPPPLTEASTPAEVTTTALTLGQMAENQVITRREGVNRLNAASLATLFAVYNEKQAQNLAYEKVHSPVPKPEGIAFILVQAAIETRACTVADIPILLKEPNSQTGFLLDREPMVSDARVTQWLLQAIPALGQATTPDHNQLVKVMTVAVFNKDPQVYQALATLTKAMVDGLAPGIPDSSVIVRPLLFSVRPELQLLAVPLLPSLHPGNYFHMGDDPLAVPSGALQQPSSKLSGNADFVAWMKDRIKLAGIRNQSQLDLARLGDPEALKAAIAILLQDTEPPPLIQTPATGTGYPHLKDYKRFLSTIVYKGPKPKLENLSNHLDQITFVDGHWTLDLGGDPTAPPTTTTAPPPAAGTTPAAAATSEPPKPTPPPVPSFVPTKVTIVQRTGILNLNKDGSVNSVTMSNPGTIYTAQRVEGTNIFLEDDSHQLHKITTTATDYTPPAAGTVAPPLPVVPPTPAPPVAPTPPPVPPMTAPAAGAGASSTPVPPKPQTPPPKPTTKVPVHVPPLAAMPLPKMDPISAQFNLAFGVPLFTPRNLWQENVHTVATRLMWHCEFDSPTQASFRELDGRPAYFLHLNPNDPAPNPKLGLGIGYANCLESHAYSRVMYGRNGKPDFLSIMFANNGDIGLYPAYNAIDQAKRDQTIEFNRRAVNNDGDFLDAKLTQILGIPTVGTWGICSETKEPAHRWDWNGNTVILTRVKDKFTGLVICPTEFADHRGSRTEEEDEKTRLDALKKNVQTAPDGDVTLANIPGANQGSKGYCVPAACERYARYLDIPADMYVFANAANTGVGGGTAFGNMDLILDPYLHTHGAHLENVGDLELRTIAQYIDRGLPILWGCWIDPYVQGMGESRIQVRQVTAANWIANPTWDDYNKGVHQQDLALGKSTTRDGHMRLIVGYNLATKELAYSENDGSSNIHWMSLSEANYVHQDYLKAFVF